MRCENIANWLNEHADAELTSEQRHAVDEHLASCEECNSAWHASRALRRYRALPTPAPSAALIAKLSATRQRPDVRRRTSPWIAAIGGGHAAGIAIMAFDYYRGVSADNARSMPALTMALHEIRDVNVTIDAPQAFTDVDVRVVLAGGIDLDGLEGRRELKWKTDLEPGSNRLTLPIVASDSSGGKLLVSLEYGDKQRTFVVQIDVADAGSANTEI